MLSKLARRNAKRSMRDYLVYLLTMVLITALMFAFNSMIFSKSVWALCQEAGIMAIMLGVVTFFIVLIVIWLVHYMVRFMAQRRSREFATYLLLGFRKKQIANLFLRENMQIGAAAFVIGLLPGFFLQQVVTTLIYAIVAREYTLHVEWNVFTLLLTAGIYALSYVLALFRNRRRFKKMNIREMMYMDRQNEELKTGNKSKKQWMFFAGAVYIAAFIWMIYQGKITVENVFGLLAGLVAAIYILYIGLSAFLIGYIKRGGRGIYRHGNLFVLRQMASKVKTMRFTLGTLTILFTVVLVGCSCAMMLNEYQNTQAQEKWPFDVAVYSGNTEYDFTEEKKLIESQGNAADLYAYQIYENGSNQMNLLFLDQVKGAYASGYFQYDTYMKLSDYNKLRQMLLYQPVTLSEDQYLIHTKSRIKDTVENISRQPLKIKEGTLSCQGVHTEPFEQNGHNGADYLLVVSDETAEKMTPYYNLLMAQIKGEVPDTLQNDLLKLQGFETGMDVEYTYEDRGSGTDMIYSDDSPVYVKETSTQNMRFLLSAIIFPLFYIGLVFICVAMTILAVQQISDSDKYRFRYQVLKNLGLRKDEINKIILKQLMLYYLVPFGAAVLISAGIVVFISRQFVFYSGIATASASFFGWSLLFFGIIYLIYFAVTYEEFKRNASGA